MSGQLRNPLTLQRTVLDLSQARTYEPLALGCEHLRVASLTPGADVSLLLSPGSELLTLEQGMRLENWPLGTVQVVNTAQAGFQAVIEHWSGLLAGPPRLVRGELRPALMRYFLAVNDTSPHEIVAPSANSGGIEIWQMKTGMNGSYGAAILAKSSPPGWTTDTAALQVCYSKYSNDGGFSVMPFFVPPGLGLYHMGESASYYHFALCWYRLL